VSWLPCARLLAREHRLEGKVTSHVCARNPVKADVNDNQLSFGPAFE
jgi:hypothetical protein